MATIIKFGFLSLAAGAAYVGLSPGSASDTFAQPVETAAKRLAAKSRVVNGTGLGSLTISGGDVRKNVVAVWVKKAGQARRVRCLVTVSAESATESLAATDCSQPDAVQKPLTAVAVKAMTLVVREHVAATIDRRDYNVDQVADQMIALVTVSGPIIAASITPPGR